MNNDLVAFNVDQLPCVDLATTSELAELTKGASFLQRIQLITKGKYVDTGKISPGHYGVPQTGGEEIVDLGEEIDIIPLCVRPKALDTNDREAIISVYDMNEPEFERIKHAHLTQSNSGCMFGPSYLVFERSTGSFYELFLGNASGRAEAGKFTPFLPLSEARAEENDEEPHGSLPMILKCRYIKKPTYGWHVPVVTKCSEPFTNLPSAEDAVKEIERFAKAVSDGVEKVDETQDTGRAM